MEHNIPFYPDWKYYSKDNEEGYEHGYWCKSSTFAFFFYAYTSSHYHRKIMFYRPLMDDPDSPARWVECELDVPYENIKDVPNPEILMMESLL